MVRLEDPYRQTGKKTYHDSDIAESKHRHRNTAKKNSVFYKKSKKKTKTKKNLKLK